MRKEGEKKMIKVGIIGEVKDKVSENNTAKTLRSGTLNVYATPAMVALMEEAAYKSIESELEEGQGSVGTSMNIKHIASTPIGMEVTAKTELIEVDRRRLVFKVEAFDERGKLVKEFMNVLSLIMKIFKRKLIINKI